MKAGPICAAAAAGILLSTLAFRAAGAEPQPRPANYFRGVFTTEKGTYSLQIFHDKIDPNGKAQTIGFHCKVEQGCQIYNGKATFLHGGLMFVARSAYLEDGKEGLNHFDLFTVAAPVDNAGQITSATMSLPDGRQFKLAYDMTTPAVENKPNPPATKASKH